VKIKIENADFLDIPYIRIYEEREMLHKKNRYEFGAADFIHRNIDEAIEFFEDIVKQLNEIKDEDERDN